MNKNLLNNILINLSYLSALLVGYWIALFFLNFEDNLRYEYLMGSVVSALLTSPFWLGATIVALVRKATLSKQLIIISILPTLLIALILIGIYI